MRTSRTMLKLNKWNRWLIIKLLVINWKNPIMTKLKLRKKGMHMLRTSLKRRRRWPRKRLSLMRRLKLCWLRRSRMPWLKKMSKANLKNIVKHLKSMIKKSVNLRQITSKSKITLDEISRAKKKSKNKIRRKSKLIPLISRRSTLRWSSNTKIRSK